MPQIRQTCCSWMICFTLTFVQPCACFVALWLSTRGFCLVFSVLPRNPRKGFRLAYSLTSAVATACWRPVDSPCTVGGGYDDVTSRRCNVSNNDLMSWSVWRPLQVPQAIVSWHSTNAFPFSHKQLTTAVACVVVLSLGGTYRAFKMKFLISFSVERTSVRLSHLVFLGNPDIRISRPSHAMADNLCKNPSTCLIG